jgi:hypothetical protein
VEQLVQRGVDVMDRAHRKTAAVSPTRAQQFGVEPIKVGGPESLQRNVAEPGQHVGSKHPAVAVHC